MATLILRQWRDFSNGIWKRILNLVALVFLDLDLESLQLLVVGLDYQ